VQEVKNQTLASTREDRHGERVSKEVLEAYCTAARGRRPLNEQHDMRRRTVGWIENLRVVPDPDAEGEWALKGDVYCTSADLGTALKGFSISFFQGLAGPAEPERAIYVPYPHYNDKQFIDSLAEDDEALHVGKVVRKALDESTVAVLISLVLFVLGPEWQHVYDERVRPNLECLFAKVLT
jgi:hypothetical protein